MKEKVAFALFLLFIAFVTHALAERVMYMPRLGADEAQRPMRRGITVVNPSVTFGLEYDFFGQDCPLEPASLCGANHQHNTGLIDL